MAKSTHNPAERPRHLLPLCISPFSFAQGQGRRGRRAPARPSWRHARACSAVRCASVLACLTGSFYLAFELATKTKGKRGNRLPGKQCLGSPIKAGRPEASPLLSMFSFFQKGPSCFTMPYKKEKQTGHMLALKWAACPES